MINTQSPKNRAAVATSIFFAFGLIGAIIARNNLVIAWPPILFYAMLVWNDYYSIKHFSKIIPPNKMSQVVIDIALVILHFSSIFFFSNPFLFTIAMIILFIGKRLSSGTWKISRDMVFYTCLYGFIAPVWIAISSYKAITNSTPRWR